MFLWCGGNFRSFPCRLALPFSQIQSFFTDIAAVTEQSARVPVITAAIQYTIQYQHVPLDMQVHSTV